MPTVNDSVITIDWKETEGQGQGQGQGTEEESI